MTPNTILYYDLPLSVSDSIRGHWYDKECWPHAATPLERFALGPRSLLVAQSWALPDSPYLPSASWWKKLERVSDRALAWVTRRVAALVQGDMLDSAWKDAWRELVLPRLAAEVKRRQHYGRSESGHRCASGPPIDVLETMRRLTGEPGQKRGGEWWFHCPWHDDREASLAVKAERSIWHCHGCQKAGGWKALMELAA